MQAVKLLKTSLYSKKVLTDVFLSDNYWKENKNTGINSVKGKEKSVKSK